MTQSEFCEWLEYHKSKFTGIAQWLHRMPNLGLNRDDVMTSWYRTLSHCTLDAAKAATDLLGTDAEPEPKGWDRHPLAIASICRSARRSAKPDAPRTRIRDGHAEYTCHICRDRGDIEVWHPKTMQAVRDGTIHEAARRGELYRVSVACASCSAPSPARRSEGRVVFDPARMLPVPEEGRLADHIDELEAFVAERYATVHTWTPEGALDHIQGGNDW